MAPWAYEYGAIQSLIIIIIIIIIIIWYHLVSYTDNSPIAPL